MLNLNDILNKVLCEAVSSDKVIDAIRNRYQVIINYSDDKNRAPEKRLIEPYTYGISKAGNGVLRAFQYDGDTYRGKPKWKLFRLDRVESWSPTEQHFNVQPRDRGWNAEPYNEHGDNSMVNVLSMVDLNGASQNNPYDKGSDLWKMRQKTDNLQQSTPINISQMDNKVEPQDETETPVVTTTNMTPDDFRQMINRNLELTRKEKEKRGVDAMGRKVEPQLTQPIEEPITNEPIVDEPLDEPIDELPTITYNRPKKRYSGPTPQMKNNKINPTLFKKLNNSNDFEKMLKNLK